jgi:hypothetical protein
MKYNTWNKPKLFLREPLSIVVCEALYQYFVK